MKSIPEEDRKQIINLFRTCGVNHVVFLMNYKYNVDDVNRVLRERIIELEKQADISCTCFSWPTRV